jgi:serine/threonine protein kinase
MGIYYSCLFIMCVMLTCSPTAPEYALDEVLVTSSDLYSLGCLIYAVHRKGDPPFKNHGSLSGLRDNAGKPVPNLSSLDPDLQGIVYERPDAERLFLIYFPYSATETAHRETSSIPTSTWHSTFPSLLQLAPDFDSQLPGTINFRDQISGREDFFHAGPLLRAPPL